MMTFAEAQVATLDQLTDELAAAGWDSTQQTIEEARWALYRLLAEYGVRVTGGDGDDLESGYLDSVDGNMATVRWDSGVVTQCPLGLLR